MLCKIYSALEKFLKTYNKKSPNQLVNRNVWVLGLSTFYTEKVRASKVRKKMKTCKT